MSKSNLHALSQPEVDSDDPLHALIRQGARDLIARAVETELEGLLNQSTDVTTPDGRQAVVRNGHLPKVTGHSKTSCHPAKFRPTVTSHFPTRGYPHEEAPHSRTVASPG